MKRLLKMMAALAVLFGVTTLASSTANAGVYWTTTNCAHAAYTKWVCYDVSAGQVEVNTNGSKTYYNAGSAFNITKGYIAYDVYECNAAAPEYDTTFTTSGNYGLPTTVRYVVDGGAPAPGNIYVSQAAHDAIAWYANLQSGYACFVVP